MPSWKWKALRAIEELARDREEFTSDDVYPIAGEPDHFNQVGKVFAEAKQLGLIEPTGGITHSRRRPAKGRNVQVWRSLIYKKGKAQGALL